MLQAAFVSSAGFILVVISNTDVHLPEYGTITGNEYTNYREYLGIPYAKAPTLENNLRWENTEKIDSWENDGVYAATSYGNGCLQPGFGESANVSFVGSEDCLYMNIWVPTDTSSTNDSTGSTGSTTDDSGSSSSSSSRSNGGKGKSDNSDSSNSASDSDDEDSGLPDLSVMICFYGGGYIVGAADSFYNASTIASQNNVIVVAFNYRLGALGFLYDETLGFTGNYGYYDQLFAVNWVYDNIIYFGGNKNDITLFGVSAGAQSIANMLFNYDAPSQTDISVKGKFRAAIMQSAPFGLRQRTPETWAQIVQSFVGLTGCSSEADPAECLREDKLDVELLQAQTFASLVNVGVSMDDVQSLIEPWTPTFGTDLLPQSNVLDGFLNGEFNQDIDVTISGNVLDEGDGFVDAILASLGIDYNEFTFDQYSFISNSLIQGVDSSLYSQLPSRYVPTPAQQNSSDALLYMLGDLINDVWFQCPSRYVNEILSNKLNNGGKAYAYEFDYWYFFLSVFMAPLYPTDRDSCPSITTPLVCHGADIPILFDTLLFDPNDIEMSGIIQEYFTNIGTNQVGKPGKVNDIEWKDFKKKNQRYMVFGGLESGETNEMQKDLGDNFNCDFWDSTGYPWIFPDV